MMLIEKKEKIACSRLVEGEGYYFFGYYDLPAWSDNGKYHLGHRVDFFDRIPGGHDIAQVGIIDIEKCCFTALAETAAWNFQQGSMLQWNPKAPNDEVFFNIRDKDEFRAVKYNIHNGKTVVYEMPVAAVDHSGKYALSINFSRLFGFRPGYGYAGLEDRFMQENHSGNDGIFQIDLETAGCKLLISLDEIWEITGKSLNMPDKKIVVNHISFNTDDSRFVFLPRTIPGPGEVRGTAVMTSGIGNSDIYCMLKEYTLASHYHWKDMDHLLIYAKGEKGNQLYVFQDKTGAEEVVDADFFRHDGHCSFSPDRRFILYDSYPYSFNDNSSYRNLYLYDTNKKTGDTLNSYYSYPKITGEIRCDLHPRWNRSGSAISFDSIHEGKRNIYMLQLDDFINTIIRN